MPIRNTFDAYDQQHSLFWVGVDAFLLNPNWNFCDFHVVVVDGQLTIGKPFERNCLHFILTVRSLFYGEFRGFSALYWSMLLSNKCHALKIHANTFFRIFAGLP